MGSRSSRVASTKWNINRLAQATGLSHAQVEQFYSDYLKASGSDGIMDMDEFIQLYSTLPIAKLQDTNNIKDQAIRIFRAFDIDHNGTLSFDEFLSAIVMMNYQMSQNDCIDFLIEENNAFGQGQDDKGISMQYGLQIFRRLNDYCGLPAGTEHRFWKEVDRNNHGYVTQEEFVDYISRQSIYKR
jgi:Ca2+-binding EF-hand superfamily protein